MGELVAQAVVELDEAVDDALAGRGFDLCLFLELARRLEDVADRQDVVVFVFEDGGGIHRGQAADFAAELVVFAAEAAQVLFLREGEVEVAAVDARESVIHLVAQLVHDGDAFLQGQEVAARLVACGQAHIIWFGEHKG